MRWPFRRKAPEPVRRESNPLEARAVAEPETRLDPSTPRTDWARLEGLHPVTPSAAPLTFNGESFGRGVAGARVPNYRAATGTRRDAPAGVLLDVATIETLTPSEAPAEPALPEVIDQFDLPAIVHRRPSRAAQRQPSESLLTGDVEIRFAPPAPRQIDNGVEAVSWNPEDGFAKPSVSAPSNMHLVGQRGSFDDAVKIKSVESDSQEQELTPDESDSVSGEPQLRYLPERGTRPVRLQAPSDVVSAVHAATGVDVGDARIVRSEEVDQRAEQLGAVAFTEDATVHLPHSAGPHDAPAVKAILAHELTHVAQQRRTGNKQSTEDSAQGEALEAEARHVQQTFESGAPMSPLFLRRQPKRTVGATPIGVQRLATDDHPADFAWQDRGVPPTHSDADVTISETNQEADPGNSSHQSAETRANSLNPRRRRDRWALRFESDHARSLQNRRDHLFRNLVSTERDTRSPPAGETLDATALEEIRLQVDHDMPYEFGPPKGVEPYPKILSVKQPIKGPAPTQAAPTASHQDLRHSPPNQRSGTTSTSSQPEGAADTEAPTARPSIDPSLSGADAVAMMHLVDEYNSAHSATQSIRERLERQLRHRALDLKRAAAMQSGMPGTTIVRLTFPEIEHIRRVVDFEHESADDEPAYLSLDRDASVSVDGSSYGGMKEGLQAPPSVESRNSSSDTDSASSDPPATPRLPGNQPAPPDTDAFDPTSDIEVNNSPTTPDPEGQDGLDAIGEAAAAMSELDLETLSRRLYGRLRSDLRRELLINRERAGVLADVC